LSAYPVTKDLPGVIGYFQVDTEGAFSTPLLPPPGTDAVGVGIGDDEYLERQQLAQKIQSVLADNRLVQARADLGVRRELRAPVVVPEGAVVEEEDAEQRTYRASRDRQAFADANYSQQIFDQLNRPGSDAGIASGTLDFDDEADALSQEPERGSSIGKVSDLKLDVALQKKSEEIENEEAKEQRGGGALNYSPGRAKRRENIALPETLPAAAAELVGGEVEQAGLRISTFESEIDPFEFSLLDGGQFVLFRKVWRDGERYIQGLIIDQGAFVQDIIGRGFVDTALSEMSSLIVAYQDDVIHTFSGRDSYRYPDFAEDVDGELLFRSRLTSPMNSLELIYSIRQLPPGAGASVLGWVTLVLAVVLVGGFIVLYRLGSSQISLARQQQDFVSAVSHELKTPLTSIRMYGEMLKEGWADEDKRQSYYEFIHDESERLSRLIGNVLELARITRNEPQFELKEITVGELMSNAESKISSQVERAGFELRFRRADDADRATISIDEDCFAQIIINLVDNAIKFSRNSEHRIVEIDSKLDGNNRVLISVRDYGTGIPKDQMQKIFQLFYRSESELTRETVGTGIGLAIVHQLMLAMNGSVDMINVEPGAEFRLLFPHVE